jgi:penicillin-binding protein 1A
VITAGKTGTTNGYKDAWFVGYSGNLVGGIWFGNDDSSETNNMTGGSLPAMTWKEIMSFAHQGLELKQIPGVPENIQPGAKGPQVANSGSADKAAPSATAGHMPRRSFEVLTTLGESFRSVESARAVRVPAIQAGVRTDKTTQIR